jgi:hypothetical protein
VVVFAVLRGGPERGRIAREGLERKQKVGQHKRKTTKSLREFLDKLIFWRGALRIETALHKGIFTLSQRWS